MDKVGTANYTEVEAARIAENSQIVACWRCSVRRTEPWSKTTLNLVPVTIGDAISWRIQFPEIERKDHQAEAVQTD